MEGPRPPSRGEALELLALGGPADEQKPLNGTVQGVPLSGEEPRPAQANKENPWSSCNKKLIGKCKLWMVIASVFVGLIVVIIVSLCLSGAHRCVHFIPISQSLLHFSGNDGLQR